MIAGRIGPIDTIDGRNPSATIMIAKIANGALIG
jgi:hypothetical protein